MKDEAERRGLKWLLGFLIWTGIGLAFAAQFYVSAANREQGIPWQTAVVSSLGDWYVWGLLSIPVLRLARRFPLEGKQWAVCLAIHLCGSFVASLAYVIVRAGLAYLEIRWHGQVADFFEVFNLVLGKTFFFNVLIYWVMVSVSHALNYYRRYRERELRASELERNLTAAKLKTLQMQLNPHFLFNTLHAISALMHKDVNAADKMIARLSDLLRRALDSSESQEVPLHQEIDFLRRYLEIEQTRFGERLEVRFEIPDDTSEFLVPNLILQPLVENAIKHGIEPHARRGVVEISARHDSDRLVLEVRDNGGGLAPTYDEHIGLANTRSRLQELYGRDHAFAIETMASGGVLAKITIPATE